VVETWNPEQYDKLSDYRRRPFSELMSRLGAGRPQLVVDLGCGSGGSTLELALRWPDARVIGVDNSAEMLDTARRNDSGERVEWVRADVEETYVDRIHLGDRMPVRLPSGATREGTVFYRSVDADYATQRDVSRTKRDIKTFEIRLRCDNRDRALAVGLTAYVTLPLTNP